MCVYPLFAYFLVSTKVNVWYSCAAINGINQAIVSRANELVTLSARGENLIAACAVLSKEETQMLEEAVRRPCFNLSGTARRTN